MSKRTSTLLLVLLAGVALSACSRPASPPSVIASPTSETAIAAVEVERCEHGVPADLCTLCTPELAPVFQAQGDWCDEHGVPESQCFICNPHLAEGGELFPPRGMRVRLASVETVKETGVRTELVKKGRVARTLEVVGELSFDRNRVAELSARQDASIVRVQVDVGDDVKAWQPLVTLASAQVGASRGQLRSAQARVEAASSTLARTERLVADGISAKMELDAARAALASAQGELDSATAALEATGAQHGSAAGQYALSSPFAGTVVSRNAVAGRTAAAGQVLLSVADLSTMWAELELPEADAGDVRVGQPVRITLEGARHEDLEGKVARVDPSVDPHSRTVRARVELPNAQRRLKARTFLRASIRVEPEREALLIPKGAVQEAEGQRIVFIKVGDTVFQPLAVEVGSQSGDDVEVLKGLEGNEAVVTVGAFLLKTEIMKNSIGAGCCDTGAD